jgi:hypothetical protein
MRLMDNDQFNTKGKKMNIHAFWRSYSYRSGVLMFLLSFLSIQLAVAAIDNLSDANLEKSAYIAAGSIKSIVFWPENQKNCGHGITVTFELIRDDVTPPKINKIEGQTSYNEPDCVRPFLVGSQEIYGLLKLKVGDRVKIYGDIDTRVTVSTPEPKITIRRPNGLKVLMGK